MRDKKKTTLSVIIPCYNEEQDIVENVGKVNEALTELKTKKSLSDFEIILVDDGSADSTVLRLKELDKKIKKVKLVLNPTNHGKGHAVKSGFKVAKMNYLLFMDADLSTGVENIQTFLTYIDKADVLIASRAQFRDKNNEGRPLVRKIMSMGCTICVQRILPELKDIEDFQCGFKMFTKEAAQLCLQKSTLARYAFDTEFLYTCRLNDISIREIPVLWKDTRTGRLHPKKDSTDFLKSLFAIKQNKENYFKKKG